MSEIELQVNESGQIILFEGMVKVRTLDVNEILPRSPRARTVEQPLNHNDYNLRRTYGDAHE